MPIYFDNAATTRVSDEAAEAALSVCRTNFGNPSSQHAFGRAALKILEDSRERVAEALGVNPGEIIFTSGGTESDNLAVLGAAEARKHYGRHIITSSIEHDAVRNSMKRLAELGFEITFLNPAPDGRISHYAFLRALREDTILASVMFVNNETGAVNPIDAFSSEIHSHGFHTLLHTDAVQAFGKLPFTAGMLGADLVSVSAHKIGGMRGVGALYIKDGVKIPPLLFGGEQERGLRPGTEALPAIASFGRAATLAKAGMDDSIGKAHSIQNYIVEALSEKLPKTVFIGAGDSPFILSLSLPGYRSEVLLNFLDSEGICVSRGSACKKGARSHVLEAMKLPDAVIDGAIRLSFSHENTLEEAKQFVSAMIRAAETLFHR